MWDVTVERLIAVGVWRVSSWRTCSTDDSCFRIDGHAGEHRGRELFVPGASVTFTWHG
jgi:hypothetical protein